MRAAFGWPVSCASWNWLRVGLVIGRATTRSDPNARVVPNRLDRDFAATRPDEKWAGDITAIWTYEGWLSLAAVLDLFSRRVVGWAMAASADETLVEMALRMVLVQRRPQAGLLHHTDQGCQ